MISDQFILLPRKGRRKFWVGQNLSLVTQWEAEICSLPLADGNVSVKWGFIHGRLISVCQEFHTLSIPHENSSTVNIVQWEFYLVLKAHELGKRLMGGGGNQAYSNYSFDNRLLSCLFGLVHLSLRTSFPRTVKHLLISFVYVCLY